MKTIDEELRERFCFQDTDGKWFLIGNPNTVPNMMDWFKSYFRDFASEIKLEKQRTITVHAKNGKDVEYTLDQLFLDYFTGLKLKFSMGASAKEHTQAANWLIDNVSRLLDQALADQEAKIQKELKERGV
jgi:hypothetical protein